MAMANCRFIKLNIIISPRYRTFTFHSPTGGPFHSLPDEVGDCRPLARAAQDNSEPHLGLAAVRRGGELFTSQQSPKKLSLARRQDQRRAQPN